MKLAFRDIKPFLDAPSISHAAILLYGPDRGLMKERSDILAKKVVVDLNDPFNVVTLEGESLTENPAQLADEANAMSMMGGKKLVRVKGAIDALAPALKAYLENPNPEATIIIEADNLSPRSQLRKLCESHENAIALPCYVEEARDLTRLITDMAQERGYIIERDALQWLAQALTGDRGKVRSEVEKLFLYMGGDASISLQAAQDSIGDSAAQSMDALCYACSGRRAEDAYKSFTGLTDDGVASIVILRSLQNHFKRLLYVKQLMRDGEGAPQALSKLQPPLFFKVKDMFQTHLNTWSEGALINTLGKLQDIESNTKQNDAIGDTTLIGQFIAGLTLRKSA
jgi:DNA polymerase-3 subunit delta